VGSTGTGSYGPACSFNPLATAGSQTTTTGSAVYSIGGINLGVQEIPITAKSCAAPVIGNTCGASANAGVAQNNSLLQSAATESKIIEYVAIALLCIGAYFLFRHVSK
jgi:hypothetical protein